MTVTKRTRFEILRRDQHTCQYCGAKAPDAVLHIDHVMPVALGGTDLPGNLVTACRECNSGKASITPDSPLVQAVSAEAAAYALGMVEKMTRLRGEIDRTGEYVGMFDDAWKRWTRKGTGETIPLPADYELSLFRWVHMGVPIRLIEMAIPKAMTKPGLRGEFAEFQYMAGIVWGTLNEREIDYSVTEDTVRIFTKYECEEYGEEQHQAGFRLGWDRGIERGREEAEFEHLARDVLQHHIDQTEMYVEANPFNGEPMTLGVVRRGS